MDILGILAMLDRDAAITSRDPHIGAEIQVYVRAGQATRVPARAVVSMPTAEAVTGRVHDTNAGVSHLDWLCWGSGCDVTTR